RPGRKAGALVILHTGKLCAYIERGGRTLLTFGDNTTHAHTTATALSTIIDTGRLPQLTITTIDGTPALQAQNHPLHTHLLNNGFHLTPNGLRKRHARR
ncbi:hypothetical protein, partial [Dermatophilus congolensis]